MTLAPPDPGQGTRLTEHPPARLLDLTRSLSRAGRRPTGVDRVERAYLDHLLECDAPLFGLVRTGAGYLLLESGGLRAVQGRFHGDQDWGPADWLSSLFRKRPEMVRRAESDLRKVAIARCRPRGLTKMLHEAVPPGAVYLNTGHSQLSQGALAAIKAGTFGPIAVLIHDTIPLDHPEYQRPGTPDAFAAKLRAVRAHADLVICNSRFTRDRLAVHMPDGPPTLVAPLGVDLVTPDPSALPADLGLDRPYFVTVGTIEPRKGHDLLLDVWEDMTNDLPPEEVPGLMICGARGWNNDAVFARLDALPKGGPVRELSGLSDGAIAALLQKSRGFLSPSRAEGYGLPPVEAAALGVPVVISGLKVYQETLGDIPVYLNETDRYLWRNTVARLLGTERCDHEAGDAPRYVAPSWSDHFRAVCKKV